MSGVKHEYDNIYDDVYDDVYDDDRMDSLTVEKSKAVDNVLTNLMENKTDKNEYNGNEQMNQVKKSLIEKEETTQIVETTHAQNIETVQHLEKPKHLEKANEDIKPLEIKEKQHVLNNVGEALVSQSPNGNINLAEHQRNTYYDVYANTQGFKQNKDEINAINCNRMVETNCYSDTFSVGGGEEKQKGITKTTNTPTTITTTTITVLTQGRTEEVYDTKPIATGKKERYNIYEHVHCNGANAVIRKRENINDVNSNEAHLQGDRNTSSDKTETQTKTEEKKEKREENTGTNDDIKDKSESRNTFECNICFDDVRDPVVTKCGHLFCWGCLSSWIKKNNDCPVCKAEVLRENVIPLYGRGTRSNEHSYKNSTNEPRPTPPRKEPTRRTRTGNNNVGLRALGVWVNPFSFALSYTNMSEEPYFGGNTTENRRIQTETYQAEIASSFFFFLGCFISLYLFFFPS